jgi:hypothetical protein
MPITVAVGDHGIPQPLTARLTDMPTDEDKQAAIDSLLSDR